MISNPDINIFVVPYTNSLFLSAVKDTVFGKGIFRKEAIFSTLATKKNVRKLSPISQYLYNYSNPVSAVM